MARERLPNTVIQNSIVSQIKGQKTVKNDSTSFRTDWPITGILTRLKSRCAQPVYKQSG